MEVNKLKDVCSEVRKGIVNMVADAKSGQPGGSLSGVEALVALYFYKMNVDPKNPKDENRDRFVLSKGHAAPLLYSVLGEKGYFNKDALSPTLRKLHSPLQGHPDSKKLPGVDASTGSLGQGVSIAVGMALGAKAQKSGVNIYTLLGDGELQEGLCWEAATAAAHYKLDNLTLIIDNNGLQIDGSNSEVMSLGSIEEKFKAFGFDVVSVADGNDIEQMIAALDKEIVAGKPRCIVSHSVKGKGISFMENEAGWHGKAPSAEEREKAIAELGGAK